MKSDCSALKSFFFSFSFSFLAQYIGEKRHTSAFPYKPLNPSCLSSFRGRVIFTIFSRRLGTGLIIDRPSFFSFSSRYECVCVSHLSDVNYELFLFYYYAEAVMVSFFLVGNLYQIGGEEEG